MSPDAGVASMQPGSRDLKAAPPEAQEPDAGAATTSTLRGESLAPV